jgi:hypothetical protein
MTGKNRIMIYGPKDDGTYVVEFMTSEGGLCKNALSHLPLRATAMAAG